MGKLSLSRRFKKGKSILECTIPVILDGSFNVSPSEHLSPQTQKNPRTETLIYEATKTHFVSWSLAL